jgi:ribosome-associated toxin RatA of RatAB toxin-antitoxin module
MAFLEKDLEYEKGISERFENDNYSIYLKSAIHPDQEKWPYRRVYNLWQILKKKDPAAKIVLF